MGWRKEVTTDLPTKGIICLAPHTSNWDFIIGLLYSRAEGIWSNFLMKREWFFWPLGPLFRHLGGIPVWRDRRSSLTDRLAESARQADRFMICVTPEGTRSLNPDWKKGFYFIAQKAGLPIILYAIDYEKKLIVSTKRRTCARSNFISRTSREKSPRSSPSARCKKFILGEGKISSWRKTPLGGVAPASGKEL